MVDLYELKQLTAFADLGTLHRVAEEFHLSTPSITRSMQHLEQYFGVPLFTRGKNRIELNETGKLAVAAARKLLQEAELAVAQVRAFDQRQRTIVIRACAPAPLWELLRKLNAARKRCWPPPSARTKMSLPRGKTARATSPSYPSRSQGQRPFCRSSCLSASRRSTRWQSSRL